MKFLTYNVFVNDNESNGCKGGFMKNTKLQGISLLCVTLLSINLNVNAKVPEKLNFNNENINSSYNLELAKVKSVVDGDTIHIYTGDKITKVRLYGIDCMETSKIHRTYRQAYENNITIEEVISQGNKATKELAKIIKNNNNFVYFKTMGIDIYGRLLAILFNNNFQNINDMMLETDYCKVYVFNKN